MNDLTQNGFQEVVQTNRANWHAIKDIQDIAFVLHRQSIHQACLLLAFFRNTELFLHEKKARVRYTQNEIDA